MKSTGGLVFALLILLMLAASCYPCPNRVVHEGALRPVAEKRGEHNLDSVEPHAQKMDELFAPFARDDAPGCAVAVVHNGALIYRRTFGMANLEHRVPITEKTVFRAGSMSKQFTAMCIALLAAEDKLRLDDDIHKYFPTLPDYGGPITVRHLIHHTSGLRDYIHLWHLTGAYEHDFLPTARIIDLIVRQKELNFQPGEEHMYSNSNYFLLGEIVRMVSGRPLSQYAQEAIFEPLGMVNTRFHDDDTVIVNNRASGYSLDQEGRPRVAVPSFHTIVGDGGLLTTLEDLVRWDANFFQNKLGRGGRELITEALTPAKLNNGQMLNYALGLYVQKYRGLEIISHPGAAPGYTAEMIRFLDQSFSVILLANAIPFDAVQLTRKVADIYLADAFPGRADGKQRETKQSTAVIELSEADLKTKATTYVNKKDGSVWRLSLEQGRLSVDALPTQFFIAPTSPSAFVSVDAPFDVRMEFDQEESDDKPRFRAWFESQELGLYEAFERFDPTAEQLSSYTGDYYNEALDVTFQVVVDRSKLFVRNKNPFKNNPAKEMPWEPTTQDTFKLFSAKIRFHRNKQRRNISFTIDVCPVCDRNIRFERQETSR